MSAVHWRVLDCIFRKSGFTMEREEGSHRLYVKPGVDRPVVIPKYGQVDRDIIMANMRTAGLTRERYFELLAECR